MLRNFLKGSVDEFLQDQLLTENLIAICEEKNQKTEVNFRDGYDHSYYFSCLYFSQHLNIYQIKETFILLFFNLT